jgi:hypothetical protein
MIVATGACSNRCHTISWCVLMSLSYGPLCFRPAAAWFATLALLLSGCPQPTGHTRGTDGSSAATCPPGTFVFPGGYCATDGVTCTVTVACGAVGETRMDTCSCTNNTWQCVMGAVCQSPFIDAGPVECPDPSTVTDGTPCTARQGGLSCNGRAVCDGGVSQFGNCYCTGTLWSCRANACFNAGRHDAGRADAEPDATQDVNEDSPSTPMPCGEFLAPDGGCMPGLQCRMGGDDGSVCESICTCDPTGTQFECEAPICSDSGSDAPDGGLDP